MDFLDSVKSIKLKNVCISDFNQENISSFLRWLHEERGNESTTINQRLSHIKGFCNMFKRRISCLLRLTAKYAELQDTKMKE
jgi:site-specific recombinase XerD